MNETKEVTTEKTKAPRAKRIDAGKPKTGVALGKLAAAAVEWNRRGEEEQMSILGAATPQQLTAISMFATTLQQGVKVSAAFRIKELDAVLGAPSVQ